MNDFDRLTFLGDLDHRIEAMEGKMVKYIQSDDMMNIKETEFTLNCLVFLKFILEYLDCKIKHPPDPSDEMLTGVVKAYGSKLVRKP